MKATEWSVTIPGEPQAKPRMTRRDRWARRPCVLKYFDWVLRVRDAVQENQPPRDPLVVYVRAFFKRPERTRGGRGPLGAFHRQKPDADNVAKAVLDALWNEDSGIYCLEVKKLWDDGGGPRVEVVAW